MKRFICILSILLALSLMLSAFSSCKKNEKTGNESEEQGQPEEPATDGPEAPAYRYVVMTFTGYGEVLFRLDPENAPITVENFLSLVSRGLYDGTQILGVQSGFVIQGGKTAEEQPTIKGEFSENGVDNRLSHTRGTITMARAASDPDSASTQFIICLDDADCPQYLDGKYAAFGRVIAGMGHIDRLVETCAPFATLYMGGFADENMRPVIESVREVTVAEAAGILAQEYAGGTFVRMTFAEYGDILLALDPENAPLTVENFLSLVSRGFYDGLTITRVQEGFVVQGGQSTEALAPIKGEFSENGVDNGITHVKGVISMARTSDPDSATSQFFICLDDTLCPLSLDGKYAGFGRVIVGMEKIDRMVEACAQYGGYMGFITDAENQPRILSARVLTAEEAAAFAVAD